MELFEWDESFLTGIGAIDSQHRGLVDTINQLGELLAGERRVAGSVERLSRALTQYTRTHFEYEERMMRQGGIDPRHLEAHVAAHVQFAAHLGPLSELASTDADARERTMAFLIHWLAHHILGTDKAMARQLAAIEEGRSPAEAFTAEEVDRDASVGPLLRALDGLFQQVYGRNRQLAELNRTLEARVTERTERLTIANRQLEALASTDVLTQLPNRRHAMAAFEREWDRAAPDGQQLACMMIDADEFKPVNDVHGHDAGDLVLRALARALRHAVRTDDLVARLGGDEFLVMCPRTGLRGAHSIAEKVRESVASLRVPVGEGVWQGSVSIGVASRLPGMRRPEDLIAAADDAVYLAKQAGRNCVRSSAPSLVPPAHRTG